jgi:hypothetical protein
MLRSLDIEPVPHDRREILVIAAGIINVPEKHGFVDQIIEHTGEPRGEVLSKIVELASKSVLWPRYTRVFRTWLKARNAALGL